MDIQVRTKFSTLLGIVLHTVALPQLAHVGHKPSKGYHF